MVLDTDNAEHRIVMWLAKQTCFKITEESYPLFLELFNRREDLKRRYFEEELGIKYAGNLGEMLTEIENMMASKSYLEGVTIQ